MATTKNARKSRIVDTEDSIAEVQEKFGVTREELNSSLIERSGEIDMVMTALICGEHPLLVGPPGTGKSFLLDSVAAWVELPSFHYLLTKFTDPSELFGPIDITAMKAGRTERLVKSFMPTAAFAFLDEIFKASSAILNTLLKVLNERRFKYGMQEFDCPLVQCVAASNEWPGENGKELGALFDRFLFRKTVRPIASDENLRRLMFKRNHRPELSTRLDGEDLVIAREAARRMVWTPEAQNGMMKAIHDLRAAGINPGDRRLYKSVDAVQAFAWLNGAEMVEPAHLECLANILWDDPIEQPGKCERIIGMVSNPVAVAITDCLLEAQDVINKTAAGEAVPKLRTIRKRVEAMKDCRKRTDALVFLDGEIKRVYDSVISSDS